MGTFWVPYMGIPLCLPLRVVASLFDLTKQVLKLEVCYYANKGEGQK
jgi:hypothetical protein